MNTRARSRDLIVIGVALTAALGFAAFWLHSSGGLPSLKKGYEVRIDVPTASGIASGASVREAGVKIGRVTHIDRHADGVALTLDLGDRPALPVDSTAQVNLRTLVGETYVTVVRGRSRTRVPSGGTLPNDSPDQYVDVDQILSVLRGQTRERARQTLQGLAGGLRGRGGKLNKIVGDSGGFIQAASPVVHALHTERRQTARLIDNLGGVMRVVGARGEVLRSLASNSRQTFQAVADRDAAVRQVLDRLPATLTEVRATTQTLRAVSASASPTVAALATTVDQLRPAIQRLEPGARTARNVVQELGRASPPLTSTLEQLRELSGPAIEAIPELHKVLCQANPALEYLAPYAKDVATVVQNLGSTTNWYDANGHGARLFATVGANDLAGLPPGVVQMLKRLQAAGQIGGHSVRVHGYDPLGKPGSVGDLSQGRGAEGPDEYTVKYPRIKAAC